MEPMSVWTLKGYATLQVERVNGHYRPFTIPITWLSIFTSLRMLSVKEPNDTKKTLDDPKATEYLISEADDLFNENKYKELYELLYPLKESNDVEILWRLSRALHHMSKLDCSNEEKKKFVFEGYDVIEKALQLNNSHHAVHKWYSIFLDVRASYDGIKARVTQLPNVKKHLLLSIELNPKDATILYILGYWCYNLAAMPWYQRKIASAIFATPPISSFEEAMIYFSKAEEVDPNFYSQNLLMLGKTYLQMGKDEKARYYLKLASLYPARTEDDLQPYLHFPHNLEDLQHLAKILRLYKDRNWIYVLALFCSAYIYKQTFLIPGSALLNVLSGALFGISVGFPLACLLTGIGATCCYLWSYWLGKDLIEYYFPDRIKMLQEKVTRNQHQLLYYLLFLRMFPMSPNWLINLACPILGVPVKTFFISVIIGLMPYNFLTVQAGEILGSLTSMNELIKVDMFIKITVMACVALGPGFYLKRNIDPDIET